MSTLSQNAKRLKIPNVNIIHLSVRERVECQISKLFCIRIKGHLMPQSEKLAISKYRLCPQLIIKDCYTGTIHSVTLLSMTPVKI